MKNINKLQFGKKFRFFYTRDRNYTSSFQEEVDTFLETIRSTMIKSFVDKGSNDVENPSLLKTTKEFIFKTYEELFLDFKVLEYSKKDSEFKFKKDIKEHYISNQLMFSNFLHEIGLNNFNKNKGTLLYTLLKFLSDNFEDSSMNVLVSKVLDKEANEMTSEMSLLRKNLKFFITEHFIDLFWGNLIQSNEDVFLDEIVALDEKSEIFSLYVSKNSEIKNTEIYKMIKSIFLNKLKSPLKPFKYSDIMDFEFLNINSLYSNRIDEYAISYAVELGQKINFVQKSKVSLTFSGFASILFDTSEFHFRQNEKSLKTFAAVMKNNFDDFEIIFLDNFYKHQRQKEFEFLKYGIENGVLSSFPNAKYLSDFIIKMADHLKK